METERVATTQAAKELGVAPQAVRECMKLGIWDLGSVIPPIAKGRSTYRYYIFRSKLDRLLGKERNQGCENYTEMSE